MIHRTSQLSFLAVIFAMLSILLSACGSSSTAELSPTGTPSTALGSIDSATEPATSATATPSGAGEGEADVTKSAAEDDQPAATPTTIAPTATPLSLPTPRPIVQTSPPVRLRIPGIGVDANVEWVGSNEQGQMGAPADYGNVAWFEPGTSPGTPGNAVIAGHLDSETGPAVFFKLGDLNPGDEIFVVAEDGQERRFVVTAKASYPADDAPLNDIFGNAVNARLNLITCEGIFDRSSRSYDQRLVVYTELAG